MCRFKKCAFSTAKILESNEARVVGHNKTHEGTDLVAWVKTKGDKKTSFKIQSPSAQDDDQD